MEQNKGLRRGEQLTLTPTSKAARFPYIISAVCLVCQSLQQGPCCDDCTHRS